MLKDNHNLCKHAVLTDSLDTREWGVYYFNPVHPSETNILITVTYSSGTTDHIHLIFGIQPQLMVPYCTYWFQTCVTPTSCLPTKYIYTILQKAGVYLPTEIMNLFCSRHYNMHGYLYTLMQQTTFFTRPVKNIKGRFFSVLGFF